MAKIAWWGEAGQRAHLTGDLTWKVCHPQPPTMLHVRIAASAPLATRRCPTTAQHNGKEALFEARLQGSGLGRGKRHKLRGSLIFFDFCPFYWRFPNATCILVRQDSAEGRDRRVPSPFHRGKVRVQPNHPSHPPPTSTSLLWGWHGTGLFWLEKTFQSNH